MRLTEMLYQDLLHSLPAELRKEYRLLEILGRGASGLVAKAVQNRLRREVVIKFLTVPGEEPKARFLREARLVSEIRHPHVVRFLDSGEIPDLLYLVLEYHPGLTLDALLRRERPSPEVVRNVSLGLASGLEAIHAHGIVHRDLKPSNIWIVGASHPRLLDFGVARQSGDEGLTGDGEFLGTFAYASPEQIVGEMVDPRADLYALGVVLHEMMTGRNPFKGDSPQDTMRRQLTHAVQELDDVDPGIPEGMKLLTRQLLSKEKELRPADARTVLERIAELPWPAPETPVAAPTRPPARLELDEKTARVAEPVRTSRARGPGAFVLGVVAGLGLLFAMTPGRSPELVPVEVISAAPAAPQGSSLAPWMRQQMKEARTLVERYDRKAPDPALDVSSSLIGANLFGDSFFRRKLGDLSLLSTALSRFIDVVQRGDEEKVDDPVWLEVEHHGYRVIEEAARSNGFSARSPLRAQVSRLERVILEESDRPYRRLLSPSLVPLLAFFETLSSRDFDDRVAGIEKLLKELGTLPESFQQSSDGRFYRLELLNRRADTMEAGANLNTPPGTPTIDARLHEARREAVDFVARDIHRDFSRFHDRDLLAERLCFHVAARLVLIEDSGTELMKKAVWILKITRPLIEMEAAIPYFRNILQRDVDEVRRRAKEIPVIGLDPLVDAWLGELRRSGMDPASELLGKD